MKLILISLIVVMGLSIPGKPVLSQISENQVKAAFVEKFTHFIEWPDDSVTSRPFVIFIFPDSPLVPYLTQLLANHKIKNKPVEILVTENLMLLDSAHIAIIPQSRKYLMPTIAMLTQGKPILTIGDYNGFLKDGGMLLLYREDENLHFSINLNTLGESGLVVSSQLLKLATLYQEEE